MIIGITLILSFLITSTFINSLLSTWVFQIQKPTITTLISSRILHWIGLLLVWFYAIRIEKQKLLLWENHNYKLLHFISHIIVVWIVIIVFMIPIKIALSFAGLSQVSEKLKALKSIISQCKLLIPVVAITAGVVEEYIFRGYIQPRLEVIFKNSWVAILLTSLLFSALHSGYGTFQNLIGPFVIGVLFSIYYWKYRNIYVLIILHTLIDLIALSAILRSSTF